MKSINLNRIHAVLKLLFKNLSEENIRSIENKITIKKFTKNEIILKSKNNIEDLYILDLLRKLIYEHPIHHSRY